MMLVFLDTGVSKKYFAVARHPVTRFFIDLYENDIIYKEEIQDTIQKTTILFSNYLSLQSRNKTNKSSTKKSIQVKFQKKPHQKIIITSILSFEN